MKMPTRFFVLIYIVSLTQALSASTQVGSTGSGQAVGACDTSVGVGHDHMARGTSGSSGAGCGSGNNNGSRPPYNQPYPEMYEDLTGNNVPEVALDNVTKETARLPNIGLRQVHNLGLPAAGPGAGEQNVAQIIRNTQSHAVNNPTDDNGGYARGVAGNTCKSSVWDLNLAITQGLTSLGEQPAHCMTLTTATHMPLEVADDSGVMHALDWSGAIGYDALLDTVHFLQGQHGPNSGSSFGFSNWSNPGLMYYGHVMKKCGHIVSDGQTARILNYGPGFVPYADGTGQAFLECVIPQPEIIIDLSQTSIPNLEVNMGTVGSDYIQQNIHAYNNGFPAEDASQPGHKGLVFILGNTGSEELDMEGISDGTVNAVGGPFSVNAISDGDFNEKYSVSGIQGDIPIASASPLNYAYDAPGSAESYEGVNKPCLHASASGGEYRNLATYIPEWSGAYSDDYLWRPAECYATVYFLSEAADVGVVESYVKQFTYYHDNQNGDATDDLHTIELTVSAQKEGDAIPALLSITTPSGATPQYTVRDNGEEVEILLQEEEQLNPPMLWTVTNTGGQPITISSTTLELDSSDGFPLTMHVNPGNGGHCNLGLNLEPGDDCQFEIIGSGSTGGVTTATIKSDLAPDGVVFTPQLTLTVEVPQFADIDIYDGGTTDPVQLAAFNSATASAKEIDIVNSGTASTNVTFAVNTISGFSLSRVSGSCTTSGLIANNVAPGSLCKVLLQYDASDNGSFPGELTYNYDSTPGNGLTMPPAPIPVVLEQALVAVCVETYPGSGVYWSLGQSYDEDSRLICNPPGPHFNQELNKLDFGFVESAHFREWHKVKNHYDNSDGVEQSFFYSQITRRYGSEDAEGAVLRVKVINASRDFPAQNINLQLAYNYFDHPRYKNSYTHFKHSGNESKKMLEFLSADFGASDIHGSNLNSSYCSIGADGVVINNIPADDGSGAKGCGFAIKFNPEDWIDLNSQHVVLDKANYGSEIRPITIGQDDAVTYNVMKYKAEYRELRHLILWPETLTSRNNSNGLWVPNNGPLGSSAWEINENDRSHKTGSDEGDASEFWKPREKGPNGLCALEIGTTKQYNGNEGNFTGDGDLDSENNRFFAETSRCELPDEHRLKLVISHPDQGVQGGFNLAGEGRAASRVATHSAQLVPGHQSDGVSLIGTRPTASISQQDNVLSPLRSAFQLWPLRYGGKALNVRWKPVDNSEWSWDRGEPLRPNEDGDDDFNVLEQIPSNYAYPVPLHIGFFWELDGVFPVSAFMPDGGGLSDEYWENPDGDNPDWFIADSSCPSDISYENLVFGSCMQFMYSQPKKAKWYQFNYAMEHFSGIGPRQLVNTYQKVDRAIASGDDTVDAEDFDWSSSESYRDHGYLMGLQFQGKALTVKGGPACHYNGHKVVNNGLYGNDIKYDICEGFNVQVGDYTVPRYRVENFFENEEAILFYQCADYPSGSGPIPQERFQEIYIALLTAGFNYLEIAQWFQDNCVYNDQNQIETVAVTALAPNIDILEAWVVTGNDGGYTDTMYPIAFDYQEGVTDECRDKILQAKIAGSIDDQCDIALVTENEAVTQGVERLRNSYNGTQFDWLLFTYKVQDPEGRISADITHRYRVPIPKNSFRILPSDSGPIPRFDWYNAASGTLVGGGHSSQTIDGYPDSRSFSSSLVNLATSEQTVIYELDLSQVDQSPVHLQLQGSNTDLFEIIPGLTTCPYLSQEMLVNSAYPADGAAETDCDLAIRYIQPNDTGIKTAQIKFITQETSPRVIQLELRSKKSGGGPNCEPGTVYSTGYHGMHVALARFTCLGTSGATQDQGHQGIGSDGGGGGGSQSQSIPRYIRRPMQMNRAVRLN